MRILVASAVVVVALSSLHATAEDVPPATDSAPDAAAPAAAPAAPAAPVSPLMSQPEALFDVDAVIALGLKKKCAGLTLSSTFASALIGLNGWRIVIHSPQTWVQTLACEAAAKYMPFTRADIAPEDLRDVLRVVAFPNTPEKMSARNLAENVKHVVVRDAKKKEAIQPLMIARFDDTVGNAFGAELTFYGQRAVFSLPEIARLRALDPKSEFIITVVGDGDQKDFKVKGHHFDNLGWAPPAGSVAKK
jgi:hypothetical protein